MADKGPELSKDDFLTSLRWRSPSSAEKMLGALAHLAGIGPSDRRKPVKPHRLEAVLDDLRIDLGLRQGGGRGQLEYILPSLKPQPRATLAWFLDHSREELKRQRVETGEGLLGFPDDDALEWIVLLGATWTPMPDGAVGLLRK